MDRRLDGLRFIVTGSSGFVGKRLVEMLVQRGASQVVCFDIQPVTELDSSCQGIVHSVQGDISNVDHVRQAFKKGADAVFHIAALVGPFHPKQRYWDVNYQGTLNVISVCREMGISKLIMSSSPSTRMDGTNIKWKTEDQLPIVYGKFSHEYAETKALGEDAVRNACAEDFFTIAVAPHQVYGPNDTLFLPNLLHAAKTGRLRIFGTGENEISMCFNDNYCHGLILGFHALYENSPALGKFYIITDGPPKKFWRVLDQAIVAMGFVSLYDKFKLPKTLLMIIATLLKLLGDLIGAQFKLNPFTVKMLTIDRSFDISAAERDLGYKPLVDFDTAWMKTIQWFVEHKSWWEKVAKKTTAKVKSS